MGNCCCRRCRPARLRPAEVEGISCCAFMWRACLFLYTHYLTNLERDVKPSPKVTFNCEVEVIGTSVLYMKIGQSHKI